MKTSPLISTSLEDGDYRREYGASLLKYDVAAAIVEARTKRGLSQKQMAEACGVSQPYIARLESGEANPTIAQLGSLLASIDARLHIGVVELDPDREEKQRRVQLKESLEATAGMFSPEDHPEWATSEKAAEWVRKQRGHTP